MLEICYIMSEQLSKTNSASVEALMKILSTYEDVSG